MDREHLILELKTIRQNGTEICEEILRMTGELKKLEEELQDESKFGNPPDYDFGKKLFQKAILGHLSAVKKAIQNLRRLQKSFQALQEKYENQITEGDIKRHEK